MRDKLFKPRCHVVIIQVWASTNSRREELIALCGGRPSTGGGGNLGGLNGGVYVGGAEWKDKSKSYTNCVNIHQYLEKYINLFR